MKYLSQNDIEVIRQILAVALDRTKGTYTFDKLQRPIHHLFWELEEMQKADMVKSFDK